MDVEVFFLKSEYDEKALLERVRAGDADAFGILVRETERMVYNLALRMMGDREDALDMSQEAYMRAYRSIGRFEGNCSFSSWMYTLTRNVCLDELKKKKKFSVSTLTDSDEDGEVREREIADERTQPDVVYEKKERAESVRRALDEMGEGQREILLLYDIEGYSYKDIARMLDIDIGTVKSRLFRARDKLRKILAKSEHL